MRLLPSISTVICLDRRHEPRLREVWPTWHRFHPVILEWPLYVLCNTLERPLDEWAASLDWLWRQHPDVRIRRGWSPGEHAAEKPSGREWAFSSWVLRAPQVVESDYWWKIDLDSIGDPGGLLWPDPEWFADEPAIISSPWGYTKPAAWIYELQEWAEFSPMLARHPPLVLRPRDPQIQCYRHKRIASWCSFYRRSFTLDAGSCVAAKWRLPIPSQDTFHWYVATRTRQKIYRVQMKKHGWRNWHSNRTRARKIAELNMEAENAHN